MKFAKFRRVEMKGRIAEREGVRNSGGNGLEGGVWHRLKRSSGVWHVCYPPRTNEGRPRTFGVGQESLKFRMALEHPVNSRNATQKAITQTEPDGGLAQPRVQETLVNPVHHFQQRFLAACGKGRDQSYAHKASTRVQIEFGNLLGFEHGRRAVSRGHRILTRYFLLGSMQGAKELRRTGTENVAVINVNCFRDNIFF